MRVVLKRSHDRITGGLHLGLFDVVTGLDAETLAQPQWHDSQL